MAELSDHGCGTHPRTIKGMMMNERFTEIAKEEK
jgi:hypothetical protein